MESMNVDEVSGQCCLGRFYLGGGTDARSHVKEMAGIEVSTTKPRNELQSRAREYLGNSAKASSEKQT